MGDRNGVSLGWLFMLAFGSGCSDQLASATTFSSLLPDPPTSPYASSSGGLADAAAGHVSSEALPSTANEDSTLAATLTGNSQFDAGLGDTKAPSTDVSEADDTEGVQIIDSHLPELSPRGDAETCDVAMAEGPPLCDPVANCSCAAEQTCAFTPARVRMFTCVTPGDVEDGSPCDYDDACKKGSVCLDGQCAATCRGDGDCGTDTCVAVMANALTAELLSVCVDGCNPLDVGACDAAKTCANSAGTATFTCVHQEALGAVDDLCSTSSECAPGLGCVNGVCRAWCNVGIDVIGAADTGGEQTSALEDAPTPGTCPEHSECIPFDAPNGLGLCGAPCPVPNVPGSECSLIPSCGCSDGETCQADATGKTQCVPPGSQGAMDWCSSSAECGAGLACVGLLCRPVCDELLLPCDDGSRCVQSGGAPAACIGHCDPVLPQLDNEEFTPCGVGGYCSPGTAGDVRFGESFCVRQSDTPTKQGAACTADYQCQGSFGCDPVSDTCQPWCRKSEDCADGKTCDVSGAPGRLGGEADPIGLCR